MALSCVISQSWGESTDKIAAEKGKRYQLTKQHGPWMIMVANFRPVDEEYRTEQGLTPQEAADELVYELRTKGIPAYTCSQDTIRGRVNGDELAPDRGGRALKYRTQDEGITVLAGNYGDPEDSVAQKTLAYIKKYHPKFMRQVQKKGTYVNKLSNGGLYRQTPGRPEPLSGAFLTINPALTPEEARQKKVNPLLLKLNSSTEYSLLENPGQYTLVVASFEGKSVTLSNSTQFSTASGGSVALTSANKLEAIKQSFKNSDSLDQAAVSAWELAKALRETRGVPAYVWHDQYRSVVTVGSFQSQQDPRIPTMAQQFGAKVQEHPETKQSILTAEAVTIPKEVKPGTQPVKSWILDPQPTLMKVPSL
jgi:hypothetical protein